MKIMLFIGNRFYAFKLLKYLAENKIELIACVSTEDDIQSRQFCHVRNIIFFTNNDVNNMYDLIQQSVDDRDWLISYLYPRIISKTIIDLFNGNAINFHPGPLPEHRGVAGCCFSILNNFNYWGVTAHQLVDELDAGDIIEDIRFPINAQNMLGTDIERITQTKLFDLFINVFERLLRSEKLEGRKQFGEIGVHTRNELKKLKEITINDKSEDVDKKIRALWLPPNEGAYIVIDGKRYTLVNESILEELGEMYKSRYEK